MDQESPVDADPCAILLARRERIAAALSFVAIASYFSFLGMLAFARGVMGTLILPGLSLCMLWGAGVIVGSFLLTLAYVVWAHRVYDPSAKRLA